MSLTFVLVHGAWHGGWCWSRVRGPLRQQGHFVVTPTLTGLGERAHLARQDIGLDTHVEDIVGVLDTEELTDVVLVGHSYAGLLLPGVADRSTARLRHIVCLDGAVPHEGEAGMDTVAPEIQQRWQEVAGETGWMPPAYDFLGVSNPDDLAWLERRLVPHPFKSWCDPVRRYGDGYDRIAKTFIRCTLPSGRAASLSAERARESSDWDYREIEAGHDAMITAPDALVEMLVEIGQGR